MDIANSKQRIAHEMKEFLTVFVLLAPFFLSFSTFRMYVTSGFGNAYFTYATAVVNALVLAKVILMGELVRLGTRFEHRPLILSTLNKSAVFTFLYLAFHIVESSVRGLWHGQAFLAGLYNAIANKSGELLAMALVLFFAFIPFFALREMRRIIGADRFRDLFFKGRPRSDELAAHAVIP